MSNDQLEKFAEWESTLMFTAVYDLQKEFNHTNIHFELDKDDGCIRIKLMVSDKDDYIKNDQIKFTDKFYHKVVAVLNDSLENYGTFHVYDQTIIINGSVKYFRLED